MKEQIGVRPTFHLHVHVAFFIIAFSLFPFIFVQAATRPTRRPHGRAFALALAEGGVRATKCVCVCESYCLLVWQKDFYSFGAEQLKEAGG
jgi:acetyl esterase/lipase